MILRQQEADPQRKNECALLPGADLRKAAAAARHKHAPTVQHQRAATGSIRDAQQRFRLGANS